MKSTLRPYHQLIIVAIILLIHGSMLMTFILVQFQSNSMNMPPQEALVTIEEESPAEDHNWVAMNNALPNSQHIAQETPEQEAQPEQEQEEMAQDEIAQESEQSPSKKEGKKSELDITEHSLDDAIALASRMLDSAHEKTSESPQEQEQKPTENKQLSKSPSDSKHIPTLAQITQGFVEHLQQADMAVKSNRDGVASIDQIKHLNYCQKILGCIVNSYKISNHTAPNKSMLANRARIKLALNRNGSIANLHLQASSGDSAVDKFLIDMFREASSSFPPVPTALKESPYQLPSFSVDTLEVFRSTQGWHIDNTSI